MRQRLMKKVYMCIAWSLIFVLFNNSYNSIENIYAASPDILTSMDVSVAGFQIRTVESGYGVCFRTICKAPDIGSVIEVDKKKYVVKNLGVIYSKDPNVSGNNSDNYLDKSYTELERNPYEHNDKEIDFKYIGCKTYKDEYVTFGYIASKNAIYSKENGYTSYIITMKDMDKHMMNTIRVRGFVEAIDENGNTQIIYGQYAALMSVAEIAYKVYAESKAPTENGHKYIFNMILSKVSKENPYYRDTEEEYGWGGSVGI